MKLSYLMPTYNKEPYISESINSFLAQKYKNIELIIVDDCSKDGTRDVCEYYAKENKNIRYFRTTKNMGVAFCRNLARANAEGEIMCVLDSDDIAYPYRSDIVVEYFKKNKKVDIMYGAANIIDVLGKKVGDIAPTYFSMDRIKKENYIAHCTISFRKSLDVTYREGLRYIDDWYFYIDAYLQGHIFGFVKDVLSAWRMSPDGLTYLDGMKNPKKEKLKDKLRHEFEDCDDDLTDVMRLPIQQSRIKEIIKEIPKKSTVLDVGCNGGYLMKELEKNKCKVRGIEIAPNLVEVCDAKGLDVIRGSVNRLDSYFNNKFDRVIYGDILEHFEKKEVENILKKGLKVLDDNGKLIITVPHKNNMYSSSFYDCHKIDLEMYYLEEIFPKCSITSKPIYHGDLAVPYWNLITVSK